MLYVAFNSPSLLSTQPEQWQNVTINITSDCHISKYAVRITRRFEKNNVIRPRWLDIINRRVFYLSNTYCWEDKTYWFWAQTNFQRYEYELLNSISHIMGLT